MAFEFSHDVFTDDDFLGVDAEFTPSGMPMRTIRVAFTKDVESLSLGGQIVPTDYDAQAGCASSLISDAAKGDTLKIGGTVYVIARTPQVDETGWATIPLAEQVE